ncbi:MAG: tRNA 2-thiocytidine(32) synthetase TtcA [Desulfobacterales bacterium]|nr:tRNA 2-thiocytidine(32) synthetase TtcA [Desulfobacterales bacterium]
MIADGEKLAVGLSGGKDSLALSWILKNRIKHIPVNYKLTAIYVDPGFEGGFAGALAAHCEKLDIELIVEHTDNGLVAHSTENRENPCFLCSRLRRKRLFEIAESIGAKKIALGHHKDDIIETLFLNMFYAGEISTMAPRQELFKGAMTIIRPLAFIDEDIIIKFAKLMEFPVFTNTCPSAQRSKRRAIKEMLMELYRTNRKIRGNIFRALHNVKLDYLL